MVRKEVIIYFVRHGETSRNTKGLLPDGLDESLNDEGKLQAKEAAKKIPRGICAIISSPCKRTEETAVIMYHKSLDTPVFLKPDKRITEVSFGDFGGKTWTQIAELYSNQYEKEYASQDNYDFSKYHGDSFRSVKERLYSFIDDMKYKYYGKKIIVVTHAGVIRCLYKVEKNQEFLEKPPHNGSVHKFTF